MEIPKQLNNNINDYCKLNEILDVDEFKIKLIRQGFTSEKYGNSPFKATEVIKEVIIEKEIEVTRDVIITNDDEVKELSERANNLEIENKSLNITIKELKLELERVIKESEVNLHKREGKKKDLYGEDKEGFFGSNTINIHE